MQTSFCKKRIFMLPSFINDLKIFVQSINRYFLLAALIIGLLLVYATFYFSQSAILTVISFLLSAPIALSLATVFNYIGEKLTAKEADKTTVLLLSQDEEIASQIRYLLPHDNMHIEWLKTYKNTSKYLKQKTPTVLIFDTNNKPKNIANLVELCRNQQKSTQRLPIIAVQKDTASDKKRQLLLEGFDDCLPNPIQQQDMETFYTRWLESAPASFEHDSTDTEEIDSEKTDTETTGTEKTDPVIETKPTTNKPQKTIFDKQQALIQSHQNLGLAKDMLSMLVKMIEANQSHLQQYYETENWEELNEITHKIKGGCYCTGVPSLEKAMETIDKALEKNELNNIAQQFESMMSEIEAVIDWCEQHDLELIFAD